MKKTKLFFSIALIIILSSCTLERYSLAHRQLKDKRYALAINNYDKYIKISKNGAIKTIAEMERAEAYYQIGMKALRQKKWDLASRFFYLANTEKANKKLDNCYWELAKQSLEKNDSEKTLDYYNIIIKYFSNSELMSDVLLARMKIYSQRNNCEIKIWNDYVTFCKNKYSSYKQKEAQKYADSVLPILINSAQYLADNGSPEASLSQFKELAKYPSNYKDIIAQKIADIYVKLAEEKISKEDYLAADDLFKKAIENNPKLKNKITNRINNLVDLFLVKGNKLLEKRKIDLAIKNYKRIFEIIPNNYQAKKAIAQAKIKAKNIKTADSLFVLAKTLENRQKFFQALKLYKKANKLYPLNKTQYRIFVVSNILRAKKEPIKFAREIILNYKNGIFRKKTSEIIKKLELKYPEQVKVGKLKFFLSIGDFDYEIRYDITTPEENYFLIWQVDLSTKSVIPLNKLTEKIFGK